MPLALSLAGPNTNILSGLLAIRTHMLVDRSNGEVYVAPTNIQDSRVLVFLHGAGGDQSPLRTLVLDSSTVAGMALDRTR